MFGRKITRDLGMALSNQFFQKLVSYAIIMLMARHLDKVEMGRFFYAIAVTAVMAAVTDLGTSRYLVLRVAEDRSSARDRLSEVMSLRLPVLVVGFGLLNIAVAVAQPALATVMLLASLFQLATVLSAAFFALFNGLRHIAWRVAIEITGQCLLAVLVVAAIMAGMGLAAILACYIVANLIMLLLAAVVSRRRVGSISLVWQADRLREVLRRSLPLFLVGVLTAIQFKMDAMLIGTLSSATAVATYEAGFKLFEASQMIQRPATTIVFPIFAQLAFNRRWGDFSRHYALFLGANAVVGTAVAVVVWLLAGWIMVTVFGPEYADATRVLRILYLSVPFLYVGIAASVLAATLGAETMAAWVMAVAISAKAVAIMVLLPHGGVVAVAWTTVAACAGIAVGNVAIAARAIARHRR